VRNRKSLYLRLAVAIAATAVSTLAGLDMPPLSAVPVHANGFTVPLVEGNSGPYNYLVGIWPAEPVVGNLHMAIALTSEQGPVTDATVGVRGRIGRNGPLSESVPAPGYFLQPWSYELDMQLREPGQWTFEIQIDSSLGETVLEVPLEVATESSTETSGGPAQDNWRQAAAGKNWILGGAALAVLALASGGWVIIRRQRAESGTSGAHRTRPNKRRRRK
jgi:hypothetical protein